MLARTHLSGTQTSSHGRREIQMPISLHDDRLMDRFGGAATMTGGRVAHG
jgi:hypothetical protein